jgi:cell wall-associated NlpC family hydrolase
MNSRFRISVIALSGMLALGVVSPLRAGGTTIDDKKAQASQLEAEIEANGEKVAALSEQYNGAVLEYQNSQSEVAEAKSHLAAAEDQRSKLSDLVAARSAVLYQGAQDPSSLLPNTDLNSVNELGAKNKYGAVATGNDQQLIADLQRTEQDLTTRRKYYDKKVSDAAAKRDFIASTRQSVEEANSRSQELLSQVKGQIATLIQQQKEQEQAALQARLDSLANSTQGNGASRVPSTDVGGDNIPNLPAPSPRAAAAIAYAEAQLGKPYEYAASGPNTYDCSGLTMMAWAAAGVSMPHYSGSQYEMFPHVPLDQLQPGDLLFWGVNGSEHVAMYIGGGLQIAATHTGDYVRIQPLGSDPIGAARPG